VLGVEDIVLNKTIERCAGVAAKRTEGNFQKSLKCESAPRLGVQMGGFRLMTPQRSTPKCGGRAENTNSPRTSPYPTATRRSRKFGQDFCLRVNIIRRST
jgi:hypothetical protein